VILALEGRNGISPEEKKYFSRPGEILVPKRKSGVSHRSHVVLVSFIVSLLCGKAWEIM
jgi:hypothetical protein